VADDEVAKSGWLRKKGGINRRSVKQRFFQLRLHPRPRLMYYALDTTTLKGTIGTLPAQPLCVRE